MLERIKKLFKIAKVTPKVTATVINEEIAEIKDLNLTEVDKMQGELIASAAVAALTAAGLPSSISEREIIKLAAAYTIRDIKEGSTNPEKLIVMRVISKYKEMLAAKRT